MKVGIYNWANAGIGQTTGVIDRIRQKRSLSSLLIYRNGSLGTYWHSALFDWCRRHNIEALPCDKAALRDRHVAGVVAFGAPDWYVNSMRVRWGKVVWDLPALEDAPPPPPPPIDPNRPHFGEKGIVGDQNRGRQILCRGACVGEMYGEGPMLRVRVFVPDGEHGRLFWNEEDALAWATRLFDRHHRTEPNDAAGA